MIHIKSFLHKISTNTRNDKIESSPKKSIKNMVIKIIPHFRHILSKIFEIVEIVLFVVEIALLLSFAFLMAKYWNSKYYNVFLLGFGLMTTALTVGVTARFSAGKIFLFFILLSVCLIPFALIFIGFQK